MPFQVYSLFDRMTGFVLPPRCVLCRGRGQRPNFDLCGPCEADLPWLVRPCPRCGLPLEGAEPLDRSYVWCARCETAALPYTRCFAPFLYEFPLADLVQALKYEGALAHARVLGVLLGAAAQRHGIAGNVDAIVPMPLHASRLLERGYNQSHEIARFVARTLGLRCNHQALRRTRPTPPQVGLPRDARVENVRGAFTAGREAVRGRRLVLLDDVVTTGSTVAAAARALRDAGAISVDVWAVARAPEPRDALLSNRPHVESGAGDWDQPAFAPTPRN
jgi:ComF family protein